MSKMQQTKREVEQGNHTATPAHTEQESALNTAMGLSRESHRGEHLSSLGTSLHESPRHSNSHSAHHGAAHDLKPSRAAQETAEDIYRATHEGWQRRVEPLLRLMPGVSLSDLKPFKEIGSRVQGEFNDIYESGGESLSRPEPKFAKEVLAAYAQKYLGRGAGAADAAADIGRRMSSERYEAISHMFGIDVSRDIGTIVSAENTKITPRMSDQALLEILGNDEFRSDARLDRVRLGLSMAAGVAVKP